MLPSLSVLLAVASVVVVAQPSCVAGGLDPSFPPLQLSFDPTSGMDRSETSVVLDDGSLLFIGWNSKYIPVGGGSTITPLMLKVSPDGVPVSGFGVNGVQPLVGLPGTISSLSFNSAIVGLNGTFLVGGCVLGGSNSLFLAMLDQRTGLPRAEFGQGGYVLIDNVPTDACVQKVLLNVDLSISLVGSTGESRMAPTMSVIRLTPTGDVDRRWGVNGTASQIGPFAGSIGTCGFTCGSFTVVYGFKYRRIMAMVVDSSGSVVQSTERNFPFLVTEDGYGSAVTSCVRQQNGKVVVAGVTPDGYVFLQRYQVNSALPDASFGQAGSLVLNVSAIAVTLKAVQVTAFPDDTIVVSCVNARNEVNVTNVTYVGNGTSSPGDLNVTTSAFYGVSSSLVGVNGTWKTEEWSHVPVSVSGDVPFMTNAFLQSGGGLVVVGTGFFPTANVFGFRICALQFGSSRAVPCAAGPSCLCAGGTCVVLGDWVVSRDASLPVASSVTVTGNLIAWPGSVLPLSPNVLVTVLCQANLQNASIRVAVPSNGTFGAKVTAVGGFFGEQSVAVVDASNLTGCQFVSDASQESSGLTVSVLITIVTPSVCLSAGEIAGIAVGSAILVGAVIVAIVGVLYHRRSRANAINNARTKIMSPISHAE